MCIVQGETSTSHIDMLPISLKWVTMQAIMTGEYYSDALNMIHGKVISVSHFQNSGMVKTTFPLFCPALPGLKAFYAKAAKVHCDSTRVNEK